MKILYLILAIMLLSSNTGVFAQCGDVSLSDAYAKINKSFKDDYSLELSETKVTAQKVSFYSCSPLNYNCFNAFSFCLSNTTDVHYRSVKYRITIKTPDGKVLHTNTYTSNISLKPDATISVKQLLGSDVKTKLSFYNASFPTSLDILKLDIDAKQTIRILFDGIKEMGSSSLTEGRKKGIIERYELAKKLDPNAFDSEVQKIYEKCSPTSTTTTAASKEDKKQPYTPGTLEEFNVFWKDFQIMIKKQDKAALMENSIAKILDITNGGSPTKREEYFSGYTIFSKGNLTGTATIIPYTLQDKFYGKNNCNYLADQDGQNFTIAKFYPNAPKNMAFFAVRFYKKFKGSEGGYVEQGLLFTSANGKFYFVGYWDCSAG